MKEVIHKSAIKPKNTLARVNTGKAGEANTIEGVRTMCMMCDGMSAAEVEAHINGRSPRTATPSTASRTRTPNACSGTPWV